MATTPTGRRPTRCPGPGRFAARTSRRSSRSVPGASASCGATSSASRCSSRGTAMGTSDHAWSPVETVAEGAGSADNHLNLKTFERDGKTLIAAAVKTSRDTVPDREPARPADPRDDPHGRRARGPATRPVGSADQHSRPIILIDETRRLLYVAAQSPFGGGSIYIKRTDLDHPVFPTGSRRPALTSAKDPAIANADARRRARSRRPRASS